MQQLKIKLDLETIYLCVPFNIINLVFYYICIFKNYTELISWELTSWEVDLVGIDLVGVDRMGVDFVELILWEDTNSIRGHIIDESCIFCRQIRVVLDR